jgi:hypothetical protein
MGLQFACEKYMPSSGRWQAGYPPNATWGRLVARISPEFCTKPSVRRRPRTLSDDNKTLNRIPAASLAYHATCELFAEPSTNE